jgi:hypothetical protein
MNTEHVMSGLAALRDTIALPELFGMVIESLGGQEALAAALGEEYVAELEQPRDAAGGDHAGPDLDAMRDGDVARLENIQGMAESFCTWLHAKGAAQMQRDDDKAVDTIRQLSGSFNKAARAARLTMVLKHEVAGLRPLPQSRATANGAGNQVGAVANQNEAGVPAAGSDGNSGAHKRGAETREDRERREKEEWQERVDTRKDAEDAMGLYLLALLDAFEKDVAEAPEEIQAEFKRQSPAVVLTTIAASIPHPNLDRRIADIHMGRLWDSVPPRHAEKPEALAPPDWDSVSRQRWNDERHRMARAQRQARRRR